MNRQILILKSRSMKTFTSLLLFFYSTIISFGQFEKINQLDSIGKKNGKWIDYLDAKWRVVKDTSKAVYCGYNFYDHGENTLRITPFRPIRFYHKLEVTHDEVQLVNGKKILSGEYKWLDKKGRVVSIDSFKNGEHIWVKDYDWDRFGIYILGWNKKMTGKLHGYVDYRKTYEGQPNSYYIEEYDKKGNIKSYYYMKCSYAGWAGYPITKK